MDHKERRTVPRVPTRIDVIVRTPGEDGVQSGVVRNLSMNGAAIEVSGWLGARRAALSFEYRAERRFITFDVVGIRRSAQGAVLHIRFVAMDYTLKAYLSNLVGVRAAATAQRERFLSGRVDDRAS